MLFNSLLFLFFFVIVTITYYLIPPRFRWIWLLMASCYFYMYFKPVYVLIIFATILIDYTAGILIERSRGKHLKKLFLVVSLITNIGILAFYKYFNFIADNINLVLHHFHTPEIPFINIILPLGLSFHTFQAMSYTIEVYRGKQRAEKHLGIYALYVMFYPQMVAGPIERPQNILPQLHTRKQFSSDNIISGIYTMSIGFFKKVVIADRLDMYVSPVFSNPKGHSSLDLVIATYFFALQIYCDFSGYSDIAIGAAQTLGIKLMDNFNMPYLSTNVSDFWRRWHISLSTWFRDYLYIPLGGSRVNFFITCVNLLIVFTISGLWHGAHWKYIVWGAVHGCLLILYLIFGKYDLRIKGGIYLKWFITFNVVCITWIFFRANNIADAFFILHKIFAARNFVYTAASVMPMNEIYYCIILICLLIGGEYYLRKLQLSQSKKLVALIGVGIVCYFFGVFNETQFIYFQF